MPISVGESASSGWDIGWSCGVLMLCPPKLKKLPTPKGAGPLAESCFPASRQASFRVFSGSVHGFIFEPRSSPCCAVLKRFGSLWSPPVINPGSENLSCRLL